MTEAIGSADLFGVGATEHEVELAPRSCKHVPSAEKVLLCNAGSEATYHAIRLARAVTGRKQLIKFQGCYHGWHGYVLRNTLSAPDMVGQRDFGSAGMLDEEIDSTLVCTFNDLADVRATIADNPIRSPAIILEPIPHNIGCVLPKQEFLEGLRAALRPRRHRADLRRGHHRVPPWHRRLPVDLRRHARSDHDGQGDGQRLPDRRARRQAPI